MPWGWASRADRRVHRHSAEEGSQGAWEERITGESPGLGGAGARRGTWVQARSGHERERERERDRESRGGNTGGRTSGSSGAAGPLENVKTRKRGQRKASGGLRHTVSPPL